MRGFLRELQGSRSGTQVGAPTLPRNRERNAGSGTDHVASHEPITPRCRDSRCLASVAGVRQRKTCTRVYLNRAFRATKNRLPPSVAALPGRVGNRGNRGAPKATGSCQGGPSAERNTLPEVLWGAALWGPAPSAIMRRHRRIRRWVGFLIGLLLMPSRGAAEAPRDSAAADSEGVTAAWLADPLEIVDMPERRDEPPEDARLRARVGWGGVASAGYRIWWNGGGRPISDAAFSSGSKDAAADGGVVARCGANQLDAT